MDFERVGVVGAGLMGAGIAQVVAQAGCDVLVREVDRDRLEGGLAEIRQRLDRAVERGRLERADADAARERIGGTLELAELGDRDLVIEAVTEDFDTKRAVFSALDEAAAPETVLATNTSSLPVMELAAATGRPERVIGLHFFSPVPVMALVEVVRTVASDDAVVDAAVAFVERLGKQPVRARDSVGFVVNRLLVPYLLDAIRAHEEGVATVAEIDAAMKAGASYPMGPFQLLDFVGLDVTKAVADVMFDEYAERRYAAPPTLRRLVAAGWHGRKSGRGFYDYSGDEPVAVDLRFAR